MGEGEVCIFQKFGFCKFQEKCIRVHFTQVCGSPSKCKDVTLCQKRHPKNCKSFSAGSGCKHGEKCAYRHNIPIHVEEHNEMKEKIVVLEKMVSELNKKMTNKETEQVKQLDIVVKALIRKVLSLENEMIYMKDNKVSNKCSVEEEILAKVKYMEVSERQDLKIINKKEKFEVYCKGLKEEKSKQNDSKDSKKSQKKDFKCEKCDYVCQKLTTLKKHVNTKHTEQNCKVCHTEFKTSMELINHVAKEHHQEEEEEWHVKFHSTPKADEEEKGLKLVDKENTDNEQVVKEKEDVVSESMLDDILLEGY